VGGSGHHWRRPWSLLQSN